MSAAYPSSLPTYDVPYLTVFNEKAPYDRVDQGNLSWSVQLGYASDHTLICRHEYLVENTRLPMLNWEVA